MEENSKDVYFFIVSLLNEPYLSQNKFNNWLDLIPAKYYYSRDENSWGGVKNPSLIALDNQDKSIWITKSGNIAYRLEKNGKVFSATRQGANLIISSILGYSCQIKHKSSGKEEKSYTNRLKKIDEDEVSVILDSLTTFYHLSNEIMIDELPLIIDNIFNPTMNKEFFSIGRIKYINRYIPSEFISVVPARDVSRNQKSIILQYIFYISSYNKQKFNYIMTWLSSFFQDLSKKSNIPLVLLGDKKSGKNILFDEILNSTHQCNKT